MNKKAVEIAIGTIVVMIISILLFGYSLYFLWQIFSITPSIDEALTQKTDSAIKSMIEREQKIVALPFNLKKASAGQMVYYWAGIRNINDIQKSFGAKIRFSGAYTSNGDKEIRDAEKKYIETNWLKNWADTSPIKIKPREYSNLQLGLEVDSYIAQGVNTKTGIYVFNVCFFEENELSNDCPPQNKKNLYPANQMFQLRVQVE